MGQFLLLLVVALTVGAVVFGVTVLVSGGDQGLAPAEPDGRAVPLPGTRPLIEGDVAEARFDTALRGYRMEQVDQALRRAAYDIGYKDELIGVLEAEVIALRDGRTADADLLRQAREAALGPAAAGGAGSGAAVPGSGLAKAGSVDAGQSGAAAPQGAAVALLDPPADRNSTGDAGPSAAADDVAASTPAGAGGTADTDAIAANRSGDTDESAAAKAGASEDAAGKAAADSGTSGDDATGAARDDTAAARAAEATETGPDPAESGKAAVDRK